MEVSFSSSFRRAFKKTIKGDSELEVRFWQKVEIFTVDPFDASLKSHKLSGILRDLWSFSLGYHERILFYFTDTGNAVFTDIDRHDEIY